MITVERTRDYFMIGEILTSSSVYPHTGDDTQPAKELFRVPQHEGWIYLAVRGPAGVIGLFIVEPVNSVCGRVHNFLLPAAWGSKGRAGAAAAIEWTWRHTGLVKLIGWTPSYNRLALAFARDLGFTVFAVNRRAYRKFGRTWDLVMTELFRPGEDNG